MKRFLLVLFFPLALFAELNVAVSYPYIGAIAKSIGGDNIKVTVLAKGNWDPHFVVPRPSLIAQLRRSDALIINGAQLEIGWMPALIRRSSNRKVMPNASSFLDLSQNVQLIQKPQVVDRSLGDVHPAGNPHFHLDPDNILIISNVMKRFLTKIDPSNAGQYEKNYELFKDEWSKNIRSWDTLMSEKKGLEVVQFHDVFAYFNRRYGIKTIGTIEPFPGISPSSKHTLKLISLIKEKKPYLLMHDVYHSTKSAEYIHDKTGLKMMKTPHDIEALDSVETLKSLFDYIVEEFQK